MTKLINAYEPEGIVTIMSVDPPNIMLFVKLMMWGNKMSMWQGRCKEVAAQDR